MESCLSAVCGMETRVPADRATSCARSQTPDRIILGGGMMAALTVLACVRTMLADQLGGYGASIRSLMMDRYMTAPSAGEADGLVGALAVPYRLATGYWPLSWRAAAQAEPAAIHSSTPLDA